MTIVIASGNFDPLHIGHVRYLRNAAEFGKLHVIINNDEQVKLKKGFVFMPENERGELIWNYNFVQDTTLSIDKDLSVNKSIELLAYQHKFEHIIFAKGGDSSGSREKKMCDKLGIEIITNIGGSKIQSSSNLVNKIK